ncbi:helix-turn-helix domain-containing protein [Pyramidobacter piscolens]|uniref:helix-turn-helix domain-containing protein n=1 Tax=Pyramidobacter piscolens TaxID=638849 RepID=UPI001FCBE3B6|nr:helix-turn-helix transcriptional regulator [Pyramidobacter piscolens]BDF78598.1 hypothetical protein CE91St28_13920 [Pyramidobacter piscolens]
MIGEKIKKARISSKVSQKELASAVGVTQAYISMLEAEKINPSYSNVEKIARFLNLSNECLLYDGEKEGENK